MIRPYKPADRSSVLALVRLNTPEYFHPSEEEDLSIYLENELEDYFVVEENGEVLGAGGINYSPEENSACLSWDAVSPDFHGKGIGGRLTKFRVDHAFSKSSVQTLIVRTSQLVYRFYEKQGFELEKVVKDYWAEGYDLYLMRYTK
ncbi:MAG: GNAT family N-acetyltransferase [Flavobacteriales bacterium]|jgi:ribosomal-protein-alanine N-acetyltransferase